MADAVDTSSEAVELHASKCEDGSLYSRTETPALLRALAAERDELERLAVNLTCLSKAITDRDSISFSSHKPVDEAAALIRTLMDALEERDSQLAAANERERQLKRTIDGLEKQVEEYDRGYPTP